MSNSLQKSEWNPRGKAIIFADEDVDGVCSAAIVGRKYDSLSCKFVFVNARNLVDALKTEIEILETSSDKEDVDVFIVDVGINKANIRGLEKFATALNDMGVRVHYFDSHSNKYKGKDLLLYLIRANVNVFNGKIGVAAASLVQDFLGTDETQRLRLLGALSDREVQLTNRHKLEKAGLRSLQAAVAWGAYKNIEFLDKITRRLMRHPGLDLENDKDIIEFSIKANNHRDNLLRHVHRRGRMLQLSETPRILLVSVLDRTDFGKARGTIAGRLAGEWGAAIILITRSSTDRNSYAITVRNSYIHKLDLELLGQLAKAENSGGSKGAYRLTIQKDDLLTFLSKVQAWARQVTPPWFVRTPSGKSTNTPKKRKYSRKRKSSSSNNSLDPDILQSIKNDQDLENLEIDVETDDDFDEDVIYDMSDIEIDE